MQWSMWVQATSWRASRTTSTSALGIMRARSAWTAGANGALFPATITTVGAVMARSSSSVRGSAPGSLNGWFHLPAERHSHDARVLEQRAPSCEPPADRPWCQAAEQVRKAPQHGASGPRDEPGPRVCLDGSLQIVGRALVPVDACSWTGAPHSAR